MGCNRFLEHTVHKMLDPKRQGLIGNLVLYGMIMAIVGVAAVMFFTIVAAFAGAAAIFVSLGVFAVVAGVVMMIVGVVNGRKMLGQLRDAPKLKVPGRVTARFVLNTLGEMIFDPSTEDPSNIRGYYVQAELENGRNAEFKTGRETWDQAGEGMRGEFTFQGDWLGGFVRLPNR